MKITEVKSQPWHILVSNFYVCQFCGVVDKDRKRSEVGHPCSKCAAPSPAARTHFSLEAAMLVNSIQDFYFLRRAIPNRGDDSGLKLHSNATDTRIVLPVLFCTLVEQLTSQLIRNIMSAQKLSDGLQRRLLGDHRYAREKRERLFPALTGEKWEYALEVLSRASGADYAEVHFPFYIEMNNARNDFIHEANQWAFVETDLERIPNELSPTFSMFALLHNRHVARPPNLLDVSKTPAA